MKRIALLSLALACGGVVAGCKTTPASSDAGDSYRYHFTSGGDGPYLYDAQTGTVWQRVHNRGPGAGSGTWSRWDPPKDAAP